MKIIDAISFVIFTVFIILAICSWVAQSHYRNKEADKRFIIEEQSRMAVEAAAFEIYQTLQE